MKSALTYYLLLTTPLRILFTRFPLVSARGGAENQTMWLATGLRDRGHEVGFLGSCPVLLQAFEETVFDADTLNIGPPPVTFFSAISFLWRKVAMRRSLLKALDDREKKPDIIVMLSLSEKILLTGPAEKFGIKVVWVEHDRIGRWLTKNPWLPVLKRAAKHATIVCVSELSRRMYISLGFDPKRVVAIPNGVPPPSPSPFPRGVKGSTVFGCLSRLSPEKGIDVLLQSVSNLPEVDLTIVGSGSEEGYIRSLIQEDAKRMGGERILLRSRVESLEDFFGSIDVLVLPSRDHDPFGLVVAEAMVRGIPTIVTDACGIAGYVHHGVDALVVPAEDPEALTQAIQELLDPTVRSRIALAGQVFATKFFSLPKMTEAYEALFQGSESTRVST